MLITFALSAIEITLGKFGYMGYNAALSSAYVFFETTQTNFPNIPEVPANELNHYLWVYILFSMVGGAIGGVLHIIHSTCSNTKGRDNKKDELIDISPEWKASYIMKN